MPITKPADAIRKDALNILYLCEGLNDFNIELVSDKEDRSEANTQRVREGMIAAVTVFAKQIAEQSVALGADDGSQGAPA